MTAITGYSATAPQRADIDATTEPTVLDFGTDWCGYCQAAQPLIASAFELHLGVKHLKIEDGSGRPLGRSFRVKLWPTLIFLKAGQEVARVVRPTDVAEIEAAFGQMK